MKSSLGSCSLCDVCAILDMIFEVFLKKLDKEYTNHINVKVDLQKLLS